jgi:hypothetical protein
MMQAGGMAGGSTSGSGGTGDGGMSSGAGAGNGGSSGEPAERTRAGFG